MGGAESFFPSNGCGLCSIANCLGAAFDCLTAAAAMAKAETEREEREEREERAETDCNKKSYKSLGSKLKIN